MFPPWVIKEMVTKKVTVDDTYGAFYPSIPLGWKGTEFRPPKTDEMYLTSGGSRYPEVALHDFSEPRIILKRKELSFEVGDCYKHRETGDVAVVTRAHEGGGWLRIASISKKDGKLNCVDFVLSQGVSSFWNKITTSEFLEALWHSIVPPPEEARQ